MFTPLDVAAYDYDPHCRRDTRARLAHASAEGACQPMSRAGADRRAGDSTSEIDERTAGGDAAALQVLLLSQRVRRRILEALDSVCVEFELSQPELSSIVWLSSGPSRVSDLARGIGVRQNAASMLIHRLVERGLLTRERSTDDRRVVTVALTEHGHGLVTKVKPDLIEQIRIVLAPLSSDELTCFISHLRLLAFQ